MELPLVVCNIQRGGPSTGLPTKTEQADLFQAVFGRNSEAPIPVLAAATPGDCFWVALEACRIAIKYMVPVIVLSDGIANGAEPGRSRRSTSCRSPVLPHRSRRLPALRDPRRWRGLGCPRHAGLEHRLGGLEKQDGAVATTP